MQGAWSVLLIKTHHEAPALPLRAALQEPHKHQVEWLAGQLPEYAWVGKGRCPVVFGIGEEVRRLPRHWLQHAMSSLWQPVPPAADASCAL